jgi:pimeloyl-ACP methyl ester carboxylesterase
VILENAANPQSLPSALGAISSLAFSENANPRLVELASRRMGEIRPSVLHGDLTACDAFDVMDKISVIHIPTLVVCGEEDQLSPVRYSQFMADKIPGALLKIIPDAGHMVMLEQPTGVASVMADFLATIPYHPGHTFRYNSQ